MHACMHTHNTSTHLSLCCLTTSFPSLTNRHADVSSIICRTQQGTIFLHARFLTDQFIPPLTSKSHYYLERMIQALADKNPQFVGYPSSSRAAHLKKGILLPHVAHNNDNVNELEKYLSKILKEGLPTYKVRHPSTLGSHTPN